MNGKDKKNDEEIYEEDFEGISTKKLIMAVVCISIFGFALMISFQQNPGQSVSAATQEGENLVIQLSEVTSKVKFYYYKPNSVKIQFFALLGSDDQPHIALDACDSCYAAKRGYIHAEPYMQCNNCGRTFLVTSIGTENLQGGCWPSYLPISTVDGKILIKISDVVAKEFMFA
ncbi:MAG: Fe-S-containing protein [Candidatus Kariarchaeaceae archaeon]